MASSARDLLRGESDNIEINNQELCTHVIHHETTHLKKRVIEILNNKPVKILKYMLSIECIWLYDIRWETR